MERSMPYGTPVMGDAVETDPPRILEIANHAIVHTTAVWTLSPTTLQARPARWRDRTNRGFQVLVAGGGLGFGSYGEFRPSEGSRHTLEHSVYVHPEAQVTALTAHAKRNAVHVTSGGIEAGAPVSVAPHKWADFETAGVPREVGWKFDRWSDLLFMAKPLSASAPT
jgi:L-amino acid N-acyltransferase YncA